PNAAELWKKDLEGWINSNDNLVLVAEEDGELFGYAIFSIELLPKIYKREKECGLNTVFVSPKSRRKGIGSKLIKEGEEWAKKRGFSQFSLSVSVENDPAVKTYLKNGFAKFRYKLIKNL
ncbi:MAG: GNAT family N-acetyltransferase, partial [Candidatus Auribacterota bacterium]|nr:GNAT family N-acetyltransferase [Candidatus Auribacterota bacterium]